MIKHLQIIIIPVIQCIFIPVPKCNGYLFKKYFLELMEVIKILLAIPSYVL